MAPTPASPADHNRSQVLEVNPRSYMNPLLLLRVLLLLLLSDIIVSHSIIKSLPGFTGDLPFQLETG
ncbi:unnamed protein product, partial [Ilex paraguariensis]